MSIEQYWNKILGGVLASGRIPEDVVTSLYQRPSPAEQVIVEKIAGLGNLDIDGWMIMTRLIDAARFYTRPVGAALRGRYHPSNNGRSPDSMDARVALLRTLSRTGYRLHPADLLGEKEIQAEMPEVWRDLWRLHGIEAHMPVK